jgi:hypothetical protein
MRTKLMLKAVWVTASVLSLSGPVLANVYDIYVSPAGDVVSYRSWWGGGSDLWSDSSANPNAVYHDYSYGTGNSANSSLSFAASAFTIPISDIQSASFNYDVLSISSQGRDDVANFSGGGSVLNSNGIGWKSFDITKGLKESLAASPAPASINYAFSYTGYSGFTFGSADGKDPAFIRITTAVPEPETYAMMLAGLGLMGAISLRRKAKQT